MAAEWSREILHQSGVLFQESAPRTGAVCVDVRGTTLLLAPIAGPGAGAFDVAQGAHFEVMTPVGILRVGGTLTGIQQIEINGVAQQVAALVADPDAIERINRRAHHRVFVALKGALVVLEPEEVEALWAGRASATSRLETLADRLAERSQACLVRDLGLGGARIATPPPAPKRGAHCLFDLALGPENKLRHLPARIIEARSLSGASPPQLEVRLRFEGLGRAAEAQLSRYLTQQQLELLRRGIRS